MQVKTAGSIRRSAVATSETCVASPSRPSRSITSASNPGSTVRGVSVSSARVTTESPPTCARGRQANQECRVASTPSRSEVARAEAPMPSWVSTTPWGSPEEPLVATTSASPSSTGEPVGQAMELAVGCHDPGGAQGLAAAPGGRARAVAGRVERRRRRCPMMARSASTKPVPPGKSSATSSGTGR